MVLVVVLELLDLMDLVMDHKDMDQLVRDHQKEVLLDLHYLMVLESKVQAYLMVVGQDRLVVQMEELTQHLVDLKQWDIGLTHIINLDKVVRVVVSVKQETMELLMALAVAVAVLGVTVLKVVVLAVKAVLVELW